jgi:hypothetical protein
MMDVSCTLHAENLGVLKMWSAHHGQQGGEWKSPIGKNAGGGGEKKGLLDWNLHDSIWLSKDKHMCYVPLNIRTYSKPITFS